MALEAHRRRRRELRERGLGERDVPRRSRERALGSRRVGVVALEPAHRRRDVRRERRTTRLPGRTAGRRSTRPERSPRTRRRRSSTSARGATGPTRRAHDLPEHRRAAHVRRLQRDRPRRNPHGHPDGDAVLQDGVAQRRRSAPHLRLRHPVSARGDERMHAHPRHVVRGHRDRDRARPSGVADAGRQGRQAGDHEQRRLRELPRARPARRRVLRLPDSQILRRGLSTSPPRRSQMWSTRCTRCAPSTAIGRREPIHRAPLSARRRVLPGETIQ